MQLGNKPYKVNRTTNAEINRRNEKLRAYRESVAEAERLAKETDANWVVKEASAAKLNARTYQGNIRRFSARYEHTMPEIVAREYFTRLVAESVYWDPEFVQEHMDGIRAMCHKYIAGIGGLKAIEEAAVTNKSTYLMTVAEAAKKTGAKLAKKKIDKLKKTDPADAKEMKIDFTIDADDQADIDKAIDTLDTDSLADMVKDKVLQVVKDENEQQLKDDAFVSDLKVAVQTLKGDSTGADGAVAPTDTTNADGTSNSTDANDYGVDDDADNSAGEGTVESMGFVNQYARGGKVDIQRSLFASMMARSYTIAAKGSVKENTAIATTASTNQSDPIEQNILNSPSSLNIYDIYLNDGGEELDYIDYIKNSDEVALAGDDASIDTDEIIAEAIGFYTALECASTIKLITPKAADIRKAIVRNLKS